MAILGISGRINSGKDTVGALIQYLLHVNKEEKAGRVPNHGLKDYLALRGRATHTDWKIKKFAGKLKDVASLLTGIPAEQFEDQKFKDSYMSSSWSYSKQITEFDGDEGEDAYAFLPMTYRLFLQKLGTEAIRNGLHPNTWVNALFADYYPIAEVYNLGLDSDSSIWKKGESVNKDIYPNWIITDLRFPNEFEAIKSKGGLCIQIDRKSSFHSRVLHSSETALDSHKFDYVLDNSSDIESLVEEVKKMLVHFKLLD